MKETKGFFAEFREFISRGSVVDLAVGVIIGGAFTAIVTSLVSKEEVQSAEMDEMVQKTFEGSLPAFVAAFTRRRDISDEELDEVQRMIDRIRKGGQ